MPVVQDNFGQTLPEDYSKISHRSGANDQNSTLLYYQNLVKKITRFSQVCKGQFSTSALNFSSIFNSFSENRGKNVVHAV